MIKILEMLPLGYPVNGLISKCLTLFKFPLYHRFRCDSGYIGKMGRDRHSDIGATAQSVPGFSRSAL